MNGFVRIGVPAFAMALAALLLQGQSPAPADSPAPVLPRNVAGKINVSAPLIVGSVTLDPPAQPDPVIPVDQVLPIVSEGFASDQPVNGSIALLVQALHSESYRVRERASHDLLCLPPNRLQDVTAALAVETDVEAISRLQVAAGHLFLKPRTNVHADAGFLGVGAGTAGTACVSMLGMKFDDPQRVRVGEKGFVAVRVRELQPGFPAAQELRNGDLITAIGGRGFPEEMVADLVSTDGLTEDATFAATSTNDSRRMAANSMFQARIRALLPGSIVDFTVIRDGTLTDVNVQLAAMKSTDGVGLTSLVDVRNKYMADFVSLLKTGIQDPSQARAAPGDDRLLTAGAADWTPLQRPPLIIKSDWGIAVPLMDPPPERK